MSRAISAGGFASGKDDAGGNAEPAGKIAGRLLERAAAGHDEKSARDPRSCSSRKGLDEQERVFDRVKVPDEEDDPGLFGKAGFAAGRGLVAGLKGVEGDPVVNGVELRGREGGAFEEAGEFAAAGDDGGGVRQVFEDGAAPGGHAEILVDIGALGDGDQRDAAMGEMECGAGVRINPGTEEDVGPETRGAFARRNDATRRP